MKLPSEGQKPTYPVYVLWGCFLLGNTLGHHCFILFQPSCVAAMSGGCSGKVQVSSGFMVATDQCRAMRVKGNFQAIKSCFILKQCSWNNVLQPDLMHWFLNPWKNFRFCCTHVSSWKVKSKTRCSDSALLSWAVRECFGARNSLAAIASSEPFSSREKSLLKSCHSASGDC